MILTKKFKNFAKNIVQPINSVREMSTNAKKLSVTQAATCLPLSWRKISRGLVCFAVVSVTSLIVLFYFTYTAGTLSAISQIDLEFILLAALLQLIDISLGAWRNHILVEKCKPGVKFRLCFKAQLANEFAAAVTPGQSGGGVAWLYILHRGGVRVGAAVAVSITVFINTLFFILLTAILALIVLKAYFSDQTIQFFVQFGFVVCTGLLLLTIFSLLIPGSIERQLNKLAAWSSGSRQNSFTRLSKLSKRLAGHIAIYQESFARFLCEHKLVIFNVFLITGIYHLLKLNLAYIILLALGIEIDYLTAMAILALLKFILYFSPTPGGSGVGELSIAALFATLMPLHMLPIYTVLYRFFCLILPAAFGAWIVMREMKTGIPAA